MRSYLASGLVTAAVLAVMALSGCSTVSKKTSDNQESAAAAVTATNTPDSTAADAALSAGKTTSSAAKSRAELSQQELLALRSVHFDYDAYSLSKDEQAALLAHARYLAGNRKARIEINGHTDERGSSEYNMALGERRAKAVAAFLRSHGMPAASIQEIISFGETRPVASGEDEAAWAQNRRAEILYKKGAP